jgi:hypothetical protein
MFFLPLGVIRRERVRSQVMNVDGHPAYAPAIAELKQSANLEPP